MYPVRSIDKYVEDRGDRSDSFAPYSIVLLDGEGNVAYAHNFSVHFLSSHAGAGHILDGIEATVERMRSSSSEPEADLSESIVINSQ